MTPSSAGWSRVLAVLALAVVLPLTGCAGKAPTATGSSGAGASTATKNIVVTVTHGKASGNTGRILVKANSHVTIQVTSDTADEVHLHGYDIEKELEPGKPTTLSFVADQTGIFEVELHKANTVIVHLQVQ